MQATDRSDFPQSRESEQGRVHVCLTYDPLDVAAAVARVKHPSAGAVVMFAGTTRDNFDSRPVARLTYQAYAPLALRTLSALAAAALRDHGLTRIAVTHRLGEVPVGEESILICVSSPHRRAAWRAGEECLEECKARVEVWKREEFAAGLSREVTGEGGQEEEDQKGVWRSNKDTDGSGRRVVAAAAPAGNKDTATKAR